MRKWPDGRMYFPVCRAISCVRLEVSPEATSSQDRKSLVGALQMFKVLYQIYYIEEVLIVNAD
jgi:hypothetical protein